MNHRFLAETFPRETPPQNLRCRVLAMADAVVSVCSDYVVAKRDREMKLLQQKYAELGLSHVFHQLEPETSKMTKRKWETKAFEVRRFLREASVVFESVLDYLTARCSEANVAVNTSSDSEDY